MTKRKAPDLKPGGRTDDTQSLATGKTGHSPTPNSITIVGIGASAGGLQPLQAFFSAVPADSGMAYVVIQHRSPSQKSYLAELLEHSSTIAVVDITHGMRLERNTAYVLAPNCNVRVQQGTLLLSKQATTKRLPVDFFFRSLAEDQHQRAIAVILSGKGMDGTLGAEAISSEGGLVVAQTPESAAHADMPRSVIATGQVDLVLQPTDMPAALIEFTRLAFQPLTDPDHPASPASQSREFEDIFNLLKIRTGHDFSLYKSKTLVRRVARRMTFRGMSQLKDYVLFLRQQPKEIDSLFSELLIRVSGFFRDPEAFLALEAKVIPAMLQQRDSNQSVRVWVPGCSTGEEAYSIAMLLDEAMNRLGRRYAVQIFATDIDTQALDIGRAGRYPASIATDVSAVRLAHYFEPGDGHFTINKTIREMIVFAEQSLVKDPPFSRQDLVSCRNLLIYMGSELQKRILPIFHYALKPGGHLFLGTAETIGNADDLLAPVDRKWNIYKRQPNAFARAQPPGLPLFLGHHTTAAAPSSGPTPQLQKTDVGNLTQHLLLRDHTPPAVLIDRHNQIQYYQGRTARFLEPASGPPTVDIMRMVRQELERDLRTLLHRARTQQQTVRSGPVLLSIDNKNEYVRLTVRPIDDPRALPGALLVLLESQGLAEQPDSNWGLVESTDTSTRLAALEQELTTTSEALQSSIEELETSNEELQSSNEELQSSNEELQSSNEELETSREELHSVNEELHAVNTKLEKKVSELSRANDDINNLLSSTDIGIVFIDRQLCIERFTPAVTAIIPLIASDLGRPIDHLAHNLDYARLPEDIREVLQQLVQKEHEIQGRDGRWYLVRIRPYRSADDRINGAVLAFVDITQEKTLALASKLRDALDQSLGMVILLNMNGTIEYANTAFKHAVNQNDAPSAGNTQPANVAINRMQPPLKEALQQAIHAGKTWRGTLEICHRDHGWQTMPAFFAPIRCANGEITHAVAFLEEPLQQDMDTAAD